MCTTAKVSNVSIYRMYERIWQNAAPCGAAFWVVNADGPLSVQIQYSKVQMPRIRASRLCLEFILLLTHLSCAELISWIAVHECSDWSHHRILKMLCDLCSHTGYFFSPFRAGETLPLATSNQIMLRFNAKNGPSARGFHFVYQGRCTHTTNNYRPSAWVNMMVSIVFQLGECHLHRRSEPCLLPSPRTIYQHYN